MKLPRPKKALGQNFLVDKGVLSRIVDVVEIAPGDRVLEVGPGRGALTRLLAARADAVVAVELDRELVPLLAAEFAADESVEVLQSDILRVDLEDLIGSRGGASWKVAANLPYNISSQVLFRFLESRHLFSRLVLMLQREVGERLAASPGGKDYGILSVLFQMFFEVRKEIIVRPGSFFPVPRVDSVVLSFVPLDLPRYPMADEELFKRLVKASFGQRRKTLWNCLKGAALASSDDALKTVMSDSGIDPSRRGETLSLREFALLANALSTA